MISFSLGCMKIKFVITFNVALYHSMTLKHMLNNLYNLLYVIIVKFEILILIIYLFFQ
jgi:hypothetical protein